MKRLSSSGLDDLNLGASFEPGATIRFTVKEDVVVFSTATVEDGICVVMAIVEDGKGTSSCELDEGISLVLRVAFDSCLSTIEIFFCLFLTTSLWNRSPAL
jgi:hypothetical protein